MKKSFLKKHMCPVWLFSTLLGLSQCVHHDQVPQRPEDLDWHVMEKKYESDQKRQMFLAAELIRHCRIPRQSPPLQSKWMVQDCRGFLESVVSFGGSIPRSEEEKEHRDQVLSLFFSLINPDSIPAWPKENQIRWPLNNRLIAFPTVAFPTELRCFFSSELDPDYCHSKLSFFPMPSGLGERLVSYLLSKQAFFFVKGEDRFLTNANSGPTTLALASRDLSTGTSAIFLYPGFWKEPLSPFYQFAALLHEAKHIEPRKKHVFCTQHPEYGESCDERIEDGPYAIELLVLELGIRSFIQKAKEASSESTDGRIVRLSQQTIYTQWIGWLMSQQCFALSWIVYPPSLPSGTFPCSYNKSLTFVKRHPEQFGQEKDF